MNTQDILNRLEYLLEDYNSRSTPAPYTDPQDYAFGLCDAYSNASEQIADLIREIKESL